MVVFGFGGNVGFVCVGTPRIPISICLLNKQGLQGARYIFMHVQVSMQFLEIFTCM